MEVTRNNRTSLLLLASAAVASVVLALVLGYVLAWSVVSPVEQLDDQMGRIARGQFEREVTVPNRDEFQALAEKANQMMRALAEARTARVAEHEAGEGQAEA